MKDLSNMNFTKSFDRARNTVKGWLFTAMGLCVLGLVINESLPDAAKYVAIAAVGAGGDDGHLGRRVLLDVHAVGGKHLVGGNGEGQIAHRDRHDGHIHRLSQMCLADGPAGIVDVV